MEPQTTAPPPLSATSAVTTQTTTTTITTPHPDSVDASPRYANTDSRGEDNHVSTAAAPGGGGGSTKLRLMCSYGGHIVPRPHDKTLCYVGGDTRIVVVDRHTTLSNLTNRLIKTLIRSSTASQTASFTIKYQLPSEDLDSLISVTTDEDLENMIDEYERLINKSSRLRLFLFPSDFNNFNKSVSSIGSLLESSVKSEDWFLNALNGTTSGFSDTSSVNCLLGLEDDVSVPEKKIANNKGVIGKNSRSNHSVQDVQSVPDSPMLETTSSFGSASSSPPVRVNVDDQQQKVGGGIEEQFSQISVQQHQFKHPEDVNFVVAPTPVLVTGVPIVSKVATTTENPIRVPSEEDERSEQVFQVTHLKQHQLPQQQQKLCNASPDSVSSDGSVTNPLSRRKPSVIYQDQIHQPQQVQVQDSGYVIPTPTATPQPQFIHTAVPPPQYLHHHHPSGAVPLSSYYQMYPSQSHPRAPHPALDQHNFVYYMPAMQPPQGYNLPLQTLPTDPAASAPPSNQVPPPSGLFTAPRSAQTATKIDPPAGVYRTAASSGALPPQLVHVSSNQHQIQPQFVGYSHIRQPSQPSQPVASQSAGNYVYEFSDPSPQGQHIYYAAQPLPPQSAAQYQTLSSTVHVEAQSGSHLQTDNNMKQQVRTSQP